MACTVPMVMRWLVTNTASGLGSWSNSSCMVSRGSILGMIVVHRGNRRGGNPGGSGHVDDGGHRCSPLVPRFGAPSGLWSATPCPS